jgi:hypothetical protein
MSADHKMWSEELAASLEMAMNEDGDLTKEIVIWDLSHPTHNIEYEIVEVRSDHYNSQIIIEISPK